MKIRLKSDRKHLPSSDDLVEGIVAATGRSLKRSFASTTPSISENLMVFGKRIYEGSDPENLKAISRQPR